MSADVEEVRRAVAEERSMKVHEKLSRTVEELQVNGM
jgi:hypothetical protein